MAPTHNTPVGTPEDFPAPVANFSATPAKCSGHGASHWNYSTAHGSRYTRAKKKTLVSCRARSAFVPTVLGVFSLRSLTLLFSLFLSRDVEPKLYPAACAQFENRVLSHRV